MIEQEYAIPQSPSNRPLLYLTMYVNGMCIWLQQDAYI